MEITPKKFGAQPNRPRTVYLSGPMSGYPDFNYPAFHAMAARLRGQGYLVMNPAETAGGHYEDGLRAFLLAHDIQIVMAVDMVMLLPGWEDSEGSRLEVIVALNTGVPVYTVSTGGEIMGRLDHRAVVTRVRNAKAHFTEEFDD